MARGKKKKENSAVPEGEADSTFVLTKEHIQILQNLKYQHKKIKLAKEMFADDIKGAAAKIGIKPGEVSEMLNWIIQEEEKGGVLEAKEKKIELVRQVIMSLEEAGEGALDDDEDRARKKPVPAPPHKAKDEEGGLSGGVVLGEM